MKPTPALFRNWLAFAVLIALIVFIGVLTANVRSQLAVVGHPRADEISAAAVATLYAIEPEATAVAMDGWPIKPAPGSDPTAFARVNKEYRSLFDAAINQRNERDIREERHALWGIGLILLAIVLAIAMGSIATNIPLLQLRVPTKREGLVFVGCLLLILGNFLPLDCWQGFIPMSGCERGIGNLDFYVLSVRWIDLAVGMLVAILVLAVMVNQVRLPLNYGLWILAAALSLLLLARGNGYRFASVLRPVWYELRDFLSYLWTVLGLLLPLASFVVLWLACRPSALRRRWNRAVLASQGVLVADAVLYLIYLGYWVTQPFVEGGSKSLGVGLPLILVSGLLLLSLEVWEVPRGRSKVTPA